MFNINQNSGIKRSFYPQTGNFQFGTNLVIDSLFGGVNVGISGFVFGAAATKINYFCNSGKILDNIGRFVGVYRANENFSISGNVSSGSYDYFIDNFPVSYGNQKATGAFNSFYIKSVGVNCDYDFFINGESARLAVSGVNCFSGDVRASGFIKNIGALPVTIFSGEFSNFSSNLPFSISGIFTGILPPSTSGAYYVLPSGFNSVGQYTGNINLFTDAGVLQYSTFINISGSEFPQYSFNLNGSSIINNGGNEFYTSNIVSISGSGIPILVSLEYSSGSGNFYTNIDVFSGYSGNITGYISESGFIIQSFTGIGTGIGGQFNVNGTGLASGLLTGEAQYAVGAFSWPVSILSTGFGTGINYTGIGTGTLNLQVTGTISAGSGIFYSNDLKIGNLSNLRSVGSTGYIRATGTISYNSPVSFDKLYVNDLNSAIVNNFHYTSISTLTSYLNSNTGTHFVTAINDGLNIITLSGLYGVAGNVEILVDNTNAGNMTVSSPTLYGGRDVGIGASLINLGVGPVTGFTNNYFTGSGFYISTGAGMIQGSGLILDYIKTFTGCWNLFTGNLTQVNYWQNNFYNTGQNKYFNNFPVFYQNSTAFINVTYNNNFDLLKDVAILRISGMNLTTSLSILITGNV